MRHNLRLVAALPVLLCCCRQQAAPAETAKQAFAQGEALENAQDFKEAIVVYGNILADSPDWEKADQVILRIGKLYQQLGDERQARLEFSRLKETFPLSPQVANADYLIAEGLFMEGEIAKASEGYYRFIKKYPHHTLRINAEFNLANCYEEQGFFDEALQIYKYLAGRYSNPDVLQLKIDKIRDRRKRLGR